MWKTRDTPLDRTVAIKILPEHLSSAPEFRQRFEREAKTISQLSHPHICALYDIDNQDAVEYLVMEYLEGETLAERLLKGSLPTEQPLRFRIEIAGAPDKAHRQGIGRRIEQQEATIAALQSAMAQQQKDFQALTAGLKEQASQIQKVSAQLEVSTPAPQMVLSNQ